MKYKKTKPMLDTLMVFGCDVEHRREQYRKQAKHCFLFDFCDCFSDGVRVRDVHDAMNVAARFMDDISGDVRRKLPALAATKCIKDKCCKSVEKFRDSVFNDVETFLVDIAMHVGNTPLDGWMAVENMLVNSSVMLTRPTLLHLAGAFTAPAIAIGSGPSLGNHVDKIRALQSKCLIMCAESAAMGLVKNGIRPHFVCPQERVESPFLSTYRDWAPSDWQPWLISTPMVHNASLHGFNGRIVPVQSWNQPWRWYWKKHIDAGWMSRGTATIEGCSTGVAAVTYASILTSGPVYLVGHDCAYNDEASHWGDAQMTADLWGRDASNETRICGYDDVMLEKNGGGMIRSCRLWLRFRAEIAQRAFVARQKGRTLVNTNRDCGATMPNTITADLPSPDRLRDFARPTIKKDIMPDPQMFYDWVDMIAKLPAECTRYPYSSEIGNQDAINMILGCIDTTTAYWHNWNQAAGLKQELKQHKKDMKRATMLRMKPKIERIVEWIMKERERYETALRSLTESATAQE